MYSFWLRLLGATDLRERVSGSDGEVVLQGLGPVLLDQVEDDVEVVFLEVVALLFELADLLEIGLGVLHLDRVAVQVEAVAAQAEAEAQPVLDFLQIAVEDAQKGGFLDERVGDDFHIGRVRSLRSWGTDYKHFSARLVNLRRSSAGRA